ncbi:hypothetical protein C9413_05195 [Rhizobium sp. SEMIA 4085]|uniref:Uncharacterized protein n=1 Tax=Rhizobium gallicum bv. gallicum R602sp TaxID=1041138 RepID=A0A0B4X119_9HYPH|nr:MULTISPECIES: hypothetical protein [Rhizobium]AJD40886.1 hypothetical protein RGR602_CH01534 [Rhizobium gallicum bv. gallicum R602sp]NNH28919.1 hypothetical protein [Rhizobium sp. SEMIA 4085]
MKRQSGCGNAAGFFYPLVWLRERCGKRLWRGLAVCMKLHAEHHMGTSLDAIVGDGQIFEEAVELAGSLFLLTAQQRVRMGGGLRPATLLSTPAWH